MKKNKNKQGFSILIAILMIWFLLILVVGMFNLMLRDMKDNRWAWNYLKSYAGAEWAMELWLLKIKEKWYWVDEDLPSTNSWILSFNAWKNNEPKIKYTMEIWTKDFSWSLDSWKTVIIPLFSNTNYIKEPVFIDDSNWDIIWNIIWQWEWMSWSWNFDYSDNIYYKKNNWWYDTISIKTFLTNNTWSYLMLFNKWNSTTYKLTAKSNFSKPVWTIISSVTVGKFRQNITTDIDNTEFLKMLKYSLYSK
jgi:hypothetical protein